MPNWITPMFISGPGFFPNSPRWVCWSGKAWEPGCCLQSAPMHAPASCSCIGDVRRSILACPLYCLFMNLLSLDLSNPFLNLLILSACGRWYRSSLWQQIPEIHYSLSRNVPSLINFELFPASFSECLPHLVILNLVKNSILSAVFCCGLTLVGN